MRWVLCSSLLLLAGCAPAPEAAGRATQNARTQALAVVLAIAQDNHQAVVGHTHGALLAAHGGPDRYVEELTKRAASLAASGIRLAEPVEIDEPCLSTDLAGVKYAFVPYRVTIIRPGMRGLGPTDYLVGVSVDDGVSWQFLDRLGFRGDAAKLRGLLPGLPDDFKLPRKVAGRFGSAIQRRFCGTANQSRCSWRYGRHCFWPKARA